MSAAGDSTITVIGAGIFGVCTALELLDRGHSVTLIEQFEDGDSRTTSNGITRNIRFSHGDDLWYTRSARKAKSLWIELEERLSTRLMDECGVAWFSHDEEGWAGASQKTLEAEGIPVERLDPSEGTKLYPSFGYDDLVFIILETDAGVLRARKSVSSIREEFRKCGGRFIQGRAEPNGNGLTINSEIIGGDSIVWACGPWIPNLFQIPTEIQVTVQEVVFFDSPPEWDSPGVPAYSDVEDTDAFYGCGGVDGFPFKVGSDLRGPAFDPDRDEREESPAQLKICKDYVAKRFPSLKDAKVVDRRLCQYTSTGDSNWIVAPLPALENQWVVGAGSGHGFKHGPALGQYVADLVEGKIEPDMKFAANERPFLTGGWRVMYNRPHL